MLKDLIKLYLFVNLSSKVIVKVKLSQNDTLQTQAWYCLRCSSKKF